MKKQTIVLILWIATIAGAHAQSPPVLPTVTNARIHVNPDAFNPVDSSALALNQRETVIEVFLNDSINIRKVHAQLTNAVGIAIRSQTFDRSTIKFWTRGTERHHEGYALYLKFGIIPAPVNGHVTIRLEDRNGRLSQAFTF